MTLEERMEAMMDDMYNRLGIVIEDKQQEWMREMEEGTVVIPDANIVRMMTSHIATILKSVEEKSAEKMMTLIHQDADIPV